MSDDEKNPHPSPKDEDKPAPIIEPDPTTQMTIQETDDLQSMGELSDEQEEETDD